MISSLQRKLESTFRDVKVSRGDADRMSVSAPAGSIPEVLKCLKGMGLNHLALISCVDWADKQKLEIVYVLTCYMRDNADYSSEQRLHVLLRTFVPRKKPELASVIEVFEIAEPYEREIHELFGVNFEGHPRLIPLFLERAYEIPPFRKDFDTRKYVEKTFGSIPAVENE